jgi:hypothetical protein
VNVRSFALVTLAVLCFAPALALQTSTPAATPALASKPAPAPANNPSNPHSATKPKPKAKPPKGLYLRAICTLEPEQGGNIGQCLTIDTAALTLLPASVPGIPAPAPCEIESDGHKETYNAVRSLSTASIKTQLGTLPDLFQIQATGNYLYFYSTDSPLSKLEKTQELPSLIDAVKHIAAARSGYVFELHVPHASALGSTVAASLQAIAPAGITVATTGTARVRVSTDGTVSCNTLQAFVGNFERFVNHTHSDTPVASVFFIDPAASGSALGATGIPYAVSGSMALGITPPAATNTGTGSGSGGSAASGTGTGTGSSGTPAATGGSTPAASATPSGAPASGTSSSSTGTSNAQTITIASATTTGSGAAANQPSSVSASGPVTTTTISTTQPASPPVAPTISATPTTPTPPPAAPAFSVNGRDLLFTGGTPGDDAWITEKKRAIALLDLPQPQVLVNAWMIQNSTSRADDSGKLTTFLHQIVNSYNDIIQFSLYMGWSRLVQLSTLPGFFDDSFYNYITLRTVADPSNILGRVGTPEITASDTDAIRKALDIKRGVCPPGQYCLGYPMIFHPSQPRLTDMLLTLLAANDPGGAASMATQFIEEGPRPFTYAQPSSRCGAGDCKLPESALNEIKKDLWLQDNRRIACSCQQLDEEILYRRASGASANAADLRLPLECFRIAMQAAGSNSNELPPSEWRPVTFYDKSVPTVGVGRAALADFLFNYKMSQEFPHEFGPYDLTASAQTLDSALAPYIHAFNEDLQAFQTFMRAEFVAGVNALKLTRDKSTFLNDGIITVQTTSGDVASVSTATQSFLNVSKAPSISQLLSSITGTNPSGANATSGAANPLTGLLSNLSFNQAQVLVGALAAYQSTSLNVGRQLNLVVKPRSLLGAEAAEVDVQLNADQSAAPTYWNPGPTGGAGSAADLSDVSQHDVTTHVRIDSIRLFDISSLTAVVSKGRDKFPLLPPFVEIPYIGTLAGIPLPAAREFHSSSAVLSAVIVPTATDIAYSLRFTDDRILQDNGTHPPSALRFTVRKATAMSDFGAEQVREFHKLKVRCLFTLSGSPYPVGMSSDKDVLSLTSTTGCKNLTFADVLPESDDN